MDFALLELMLRGLVQAKWEAVREALRKGRFVVQDPKTGEWFVKFPIKTSAEDFGKAVAAFGRAILRKLRDAL